MVGYSISSLEQLVPAAEALSWRHDRSSRRRVIGKQVWILYDLVTVSREPITIVMYSHWSGPDWEGGYGCWAASQETCQLLVQEYGSRPRVIGRTGLRRLKRAWAVLSTVIVIYRDWYIWGNGPRRHVYDRRFLTQTVNDCFCGNLLQGMVISIYSPGTIPQGMRVPVRKESDAQGMFPVFFCVCRTGEIFSCFWRIPILSRIAVKGRAPDASSCGHEFSNTP